VSIHRPPYFNSLFGLPENLLLVPACWFFVFNEYYFLGGAIVRKITEKEYFMTEIDVNIEASFLKILYKILRQRSYFRSTSSKYPDNGKICYKLLSMIIFELNDVGSE